MNSLKNSNIRTLGDLVRQTESQILQVKNFGKKSLQEIADLLEREGLNFGMRFEESGDGGVRVLDWGTPPSRAAAAAPDDDGGVTAMRHRKAGRQLRRTSEQKLALMRNLATSLIEHGAIETTEAKAKELRPFVEKLITKARSGTLHARRLGRPPHPEARDGRQAVPGDRTASSRRGRAATRAFSRPATARVTAPRWRASSSVEG